MIKVSPELAYILYRPAGMEKFKEFEKMNVSKNIEEGKYNRDFQGYLDDRIAYIQKVRALDERFKADCLKELGLTDHPKADMLYKLVYDNFHGHGWNDVWSYLQDFAELLK